VNTVTERRGARRTQTSTAPTTIRENNAVLLVHSALTSLLLQSSTDLVLLATERISAVRCLRWTAITTPISAANPVQSTTLALRVTFSHITQLILKKDCSREFVYKFMDLHLWIIVIYTIKRAI